MKSGTNMKMNVAGGCECDYEADDQVGVEAVYDVEGGPVAES